MTEITGRAYALIEGRSFDEGKRVITGMATTPTVDRMGDIVAPEGVQVAKDIPLFLYHDSEKTVGRAQLHKATKGGIPFSASLPNVVEAGALKDRVDEAWQMLSYGLITAVSIGFRVIGDSYELLKGGGIKFLATEVMELSLVPVPAQPEAVIHSIKSADPAARARLIEQITAAEQARCAKSVGRSDSAAQHLGAIRLRHPGAVYLNTPH